MRDNPSPIEWIDDLDFLVLDATKHIMPPKKKASNPGGPKPGTKQAKAAAEIKDKDKKAAAVPEEPKKTNREGGYWRRIMDGQTTRQYALRALPKAKMGEARV